MQKNYRPSSLGLLPAEAGTCLVQAYFDGGQIDIVRSSVIGWQVHTDRSITPLTIDPRAADDDNWCVQHPDGRVENAGGGTWATETAWVDNMRRQGRDAA